MLYFQIVSWPLNRDSNCAASWVTPVAPTRVVAPLQFRVFSFSSKKAAQFPAKPEKSLWTGARNGNLLAASFPGYARWQSSEAEKHNGARGRTLRFQTAVDRRTASDNGGLCMALHAASLCLVAHAIVVPLVRARRFSGKEESLTCRRAASAPILCHYTANYWPGMRTAVLIVFCKDTWKTAICCPFVDSHLNASASVALRYSGKRQINQRPPLIIELTNTGEDMTQHGQLLQWGWVCAFVFCKLYFGIMVRQ